MDDLALVHEYAALRSEQAFATLVGRHVDLVYSAALRQVRDPHLAQEVTQSVFIRLARKAATIREGVILSGWLFRTTRFVASEVLRMENRRRHREQKAMETFLETRADSPWEHIAPLLDDALAGLSETDRNAMLLRFFERKSLKEVGRALGMSDDAAQKRVTRALEKLRSFLARRGQVISASVLSGALSASAVQSAPAALAASVTAAAIVSGATAGSTLTLGSLKFMALTNLKSAVAVGVCAITAGTTLVIESQKVSKLRAENQRLAAQFAALQASGEEEKVRAESGNSEIERLRRDAAEVYKLRGEVAQLRQGRDDATRLRAQIGALEMKLKQTSQPKANEEPQPTTEQEQEQQVSIAKMNYLRDWTLAFVLYAEAHQGQIPKDFSEAERFLPANFNNRFESGEFEIVYQGSLTSASKTAAFDPSRTIVLREKEPRQSSNGRWARAYAFADGHSEIHLAPMPDGFADWEKERLVGGVPGQ
jgi:RNA polymerase sigma factor (sigma-70 family)